MKEDNELAKFFPVIIICISILVIYFVPKIFTKKNSIEDSKNVVIKKSKYSINEYIPIMVSDEQMSRKYILDYLNIYYQDYKEAYYLLDEDYRNGTFGNYDKFKNYMNTNNFTYEIEQYSVYDIGHYKYYDIYDKNGNRIIFKTNGVMQYSVMFDRNFD